MCIYLINIFCNQLPCILAAKTRNFGNFLTNIFKVPFYSRVKKLLIENHFFHYFDCKSSVFCLNQVKYFFNFGLFFPNIFFPFYLYASFYGNLLKNYIRPSLIISSLKDTRPSPLPLFIIRCDCCYGISEDTRNIKNRERERDKLSPNLSLSLVLTNAVH